MAAPVAKRARSDEPGTGGGGAAALSKSEATQYDRQIRLWGLDAQRRIRQAKVDDKNPARALGTSQLYHPV